MAKRYLCECGYCTRRVEVPDNIEDQRDELGTAHGFPMFIRHPQCAGSKEENGHRVLKRTARYVIARDARHVSGESSEAGG